MLNNIEQGDVTQSGDGRQFLVIPDRVFLSVLYTGDYEKKVTRFIRSYLNETDTCVDIGANFGWYSTLFGTIASSVWGFEPGNRVYSILKKNLELNNLQDKVNIRHVAVGAEPGQASFVIEGSSNTESALGYINNEAAADTVEHTIEVVTLSDELAEQVNKIAIIKIDVEGFELRVLQGATSILDCENPPVIICEANTEALARANSSRQQLAQLLTDSGYTLYDINSEGKFKKDDGTASDLLCVPAKGEFKVRLETLFMLQD